MSAPSFPARVRVSPWALFGLAAFAVAVAHGLLLLVRFSHVPLLRPAHFLPLGIHLACVAAAALAWRRAGGRADAALPAAGLLLAGLGLVLQARMGAYDWADPASPRHGVLPLAVLAMIATYAAFRRERWTALERVAGPAWLLAVAVLAAVCLAGRRYRGMVFLPGRVNPAEIVKVLIAVFVAGFLARARLAAAGRIAPPAGATVRRAGRFAVLWAVPMGLLLWQRDLGMILMLHAVAFLVLLQATRRPALLAWGAAGAAALAVALFALTAHGAARVAVWRDPFGDATGRGWQVLQALAALYSGGLWGSGVGAGFPQAVPVAASDFIYVALGEELGFAGCAAVLGIYFALLRRALVPAFRREGGFGALLAGGLAAALGVQVLWNVAGVVKAVPLTGITLPFLSQGGSSLLTSFVALGLLMALSEGDEDRDANP